MSVTTVSLAKAAEGGIYLQCLYHNPALYNLGV